MTNLQPATWTKCCSNERPLKSCCFVFILLEKYLRNKKGTLFRRTLNMAANRKRSLLVRLSHQLGYSLISRTFRAQINRPVKQTDVCIIFRKSRTFCSVLIAFSAFYFDEMSQHLLISPATWRLMKPARANQRGLTMLPRAWLLWRTLQLSTMASLTASTARPGKQVNYWISIIWNTSRLANDITAWLCFYIGCL